MAQVLNKIAAYFFATALIVVVLEGSCSAENNYKYDVKDGKGMIANRFQNESSSTPATNGTTNATTTTTTTPKPTPRPVPENGTKFSDSVSKNETRSYSLELPQHGLVISLSATKGAVTGYYSFTNSTPNSNDMKLDSNGTTTITRPSSRNNLQQEVSQVYIGIYGTEATNQFDVTATPAEPSSAVSLYVNVSATAFCLVLCSFISQFNS